MLSEMEIESSRESWLAAPAVERRWSEGRVLVKATKRQSTKRGRPMKGARSVAFEILAHDGSCPYT
jgi:hypothetical protein